MTNNLQSQEKLSIQSLFPFLRWPYISATELFSFFRSLDEITLKLLNVFFAWENHKAMFSAFQAWLGDNVTGTTRKTVCGRITKLKEKGILMTFGETYDKLIYVMNPIFHTRAIRELLSSFIETFNRFPTRILFCLSLVTPIVSNKELRREAYEESAFASQTARQSYLVDAQPLRGNALTPQGGFGRGNAPPSSLENKPINGIEAWPSEVASCDELCKIGLHKPWCDNV